MGGGVSGGGEKATGRVTEALLSRLESARAAGHRECPREEGLALVAAAAWCARGTGRHELALGEGLDVLARRGFLQRLGRSSVTDVGREDLGLPGAYARRLRRDAARLRFWPRLRAAVAAGEVTMRKAEVLLESDDVHSRDDAFWTARAKLDTVRELAAAVGADPEARGDFQSLLVSLPASGQGDVWQALDSARLVDGGATGRSRQVEVLLMEYLGTFSLPLEESPPARGPAVVPPRAGGAGAAEEGKAADGSEATESHSTDEGAATDEDAGTDEGAATDEGDATDEGAATDEDAGTDEGAATDEGDATDEGAATDEGDATDDGDATDEGAATDEGPAPRHRPEDDWPFDAQASLARLKALVQERAAMDEWLRRACLLVQHFRAYTLAGFTSFKHWCTEALGLSHDTVRHLVAVEKHLQRLPPLRDAVRAGTLTLEQARHVGRNATLADVGRRIVEAAARPALDTQRQAEAEEERRMREVGMMKLAVSGRVQRLFTDALAAARYHRHGDTAAEALQCIAAHFLLTWREAVKRGLRDAGPAMRRDDWRCQVPGCSQGAEHLHHIIWRCRGGRNNQRNLIALCWHHHRLGVHQGHLHISGEAPDDVTITLDGGEVLVRGWYQQPDREAA